MAHERNGLASLLSARVGSATPSQSSREAKHGLLSRLDQRLIAIVLFILLVPSAGGCTDCFGHQSCDYTPYWLYDSPTPHVITAATVNPGFEGSPDVAEALVGGTIALSEDEILTVRWNQQGLDWVVTVNLNGMPWTDANG